MRTHAAMLIVCSTAFFGCAGRAASVDAGPEVDANAPDVGPPFDASIADGSSDGASEWDGGGDHDADVSDAEHRDTTPSPEVDRLVFVITPHGTLNDEWSAEDAFERPILSPLAPFRDRIVRITGLDASMPPDASMTHQAPGALLGGGREASEFARYAGLRMYSPPGPTIDQRLAELLGSSSPFPSVELGVTRVGAGFIPELAHVYRAARVPVPFESDPLAARDRLGVEVSFPDRLAVWLRDPDATPQVVRAHLDLIAASLDADLTRFVTFDVALSQQAFTWLGQDTRYHDLAHELGGGLGADESAQARARAQYEACQGWFASMVAYLAELLAVREGSDGSSLLDHTLIVWVTDSGGPSPIAHSNRDLPVLLLGNVSAGMRGDRRIDSDRSMNDLWLTVGSALGVDIRPFGEPSVTPSLIEGLFGEL